MKSNKTCPLWVNVPRVYSFFWIHFFKLENFVTPSMRSLNIREPPTPAEGTGALPPALREMRQRNGNEKKESRWKEEIGGEGKWGEPGHNSHFWLQHWTAVNTQYNIITVQNSERLSILLRHTEEKFSPYFYILRRCQCHCPLGNTWGSAPQLLKVTAAAMTIQSGP